MKYDYFMITYHVPGAYVSSYMIFECLFYLLFYMFKYFPLKTIYVKRKKGQKNNMIKFHILNSDGSSLD